MGAQLVFLLAQRGIPSSVYPVLTFASHPDVQKFKPTALRMAKLYATAHRFQMHLYTKNVPAHATEVLIGVRVVN